MRRMEPVANDASTGVANDDMVSLSVPISAESSLELALLNCSAPPAGVGVENSWIVHA